ncbi:MAG: DUF1385 domain-containing protein [Dehalococcoidales bacterium]|nr:DUF1385 domain-containing protein [Dehalococcoidales bacterium]
MADERRFSYGGQAVIEGVMIRGRQAVVTAVRRPNGEIVTRVMKPSGFASGRLRRMPLVRGVIILIEAMVLGIQSLLYSANVAVEEELEEIPQKVLWVTLGLGVALAIILFLVIPLVLTNLLREYLPGSLAFNAVEGAIRIIIFIGYLKVVSFMPDIRRVFTYHGAEHKTVNAYEAGQPLEVEAVRPYGTAHVRCGTSFLFLVLLLAIIVFTFVGRQELWIMVLSRILLIPVIMALGYEVIHFGARHSRNWLMKVVLAPGLFLQALTTGEPDDRQLEVAITAMKEALAADAGTEKS